MTGDLRINSDRLWRAAMFRFGRRLRCHATPLRAGTGTGGLARQEQESECPTDQEI